MGSDNSSPQVLCASTLSSAAVAALVAATIVLATGCGDAARTRPLDTSWIEYPGARRVDQIDVYHGKEIADPYRWLEEENSEESRAWLAAQDEIAGHFFAQLPEHRKIMAYLQENWLDGVGTVPVRQGQNSFFFRSVAGKPHSVLYVRKGGGEPQVVFDLNENDPEGLRSITTSITVSPQGRYVSYPIHYAGADAAEIHLHDTEAGRALDEVLPTAYVFVTDWLPDESGFFYTWIDLPTLMGRDTDKEPGIYLHRIGTPVDRDVLIYRRPWQGQFMAAAVVADDEKHLLIADLNIMGSRGGWGVRSLEADAGTPVVWLIDPAATYRFAFVGSRGSELFVVTDFGAPNWRILALDIGKPGLENAREVVPEGPEPISIVAGSNSGHLVLHEDRLYVTYIQHTSHVIRIFDLTGARQGEVKLPFMGSVSSIRATEDDPVLHVGLTSFLVPHSVYAYDTRDGALTPVETVNTPPAFAAYEIDRVFYSSYDGARIPMTIIQSRAPGKGPSKVLLYGYGGWGIPLLPAFDNRIHAWLHLGGIYAIANLRGGGEYGDTWHQAGQFFNKQDVFDDFFAAAEYLVDEGYTTHSRIAILGGSNGGLLTAASYNQRPELFGAVVSEVAAVDMLRIQDTPVGATVTHELGHPGQSQEMFEYLLSYSPLHNVRHDRRHPPILNMVGENDPRCKPGHIYKYVAELQRTGDPERLVLLRLIRGTGHGSPRRDLMIGWFADEVAFAWRMTE